MTNFAAIFPESYIKVFCEIILCNISNTSAMFQIFPEKVKSSSTVPGVVARGHDDIMMISSLLQ